MMRHTEPDVAKEIVRGRMVALWRATRVPHENRRQPSRSRSAGSNQSFCELAKPSQDRKRSEYL
jgi:hypothetical protein